MTPASARACPTLALDHHHSNAGSKDFATSYS